MDEHTIRAARATARDAGVARLRSLTFASVAGATALTGLFAGVVAKAVPGRKTVTTPARTAKTAHRTTAAAKPAPAPMPAPVPVQSQAPPPPSPTAPAQAPSSVQSAPPVVVSGGS